jgi:xanthine dehydrogenase YagS FAD-binding subunit
MAPFEYSAEPFEYSAESFEYIAARDEAHAVEAGARGLFIAGGTNVVDHLRLGVLRPAAVVDITHLPLGSIDDDRGGLRIGALVPNTDVAYHPLVGQRYPMLRQALLSGASPQLRNLATTGGNLLQRTRCPYFRDPEVPQCNKRRPGSGCAALGGYNRSHAVLGTSARCIATHPSDQNVALVALDATIHTRSARGTRAIPIRDFYKLPGDHPEIESALGPGELVTHVALPALPFARRSHYLKVRDRASFAFALASAAVALDVAGDRIEDARVALGGLATVPWRSRQAEQALIGQRPAPEVFRRAAEAAFAGAVAQPTNRFKIELGKRTLVRALAELAGLPELAEPGGAR